jgi:ketosteroid isomerase-like protein
MHSTTSGQEFYNEQIALLQPGKTDELIDRHYHDDAVLVSFARVIRGRDALQEYFRGYMQLLQRLEILSLDQFVETGDSILFEATVRTALGDSRVFDAFVLRDGKATHHFTGVI